MNNKKSMNLLAIIKKLNKLEFKYCLLWETAIYAWGISNNVNLQFVDILIIEDSSIAKFTKNKEGYYSIEDATFKDVRFWTTKHLKLNDQIEVTECAQYDCYALAPEMQIQKMQYFPERNLYQEDIARLAASVYIDELTETDLEYYSQYVRN